MNLCFVGYGSIAHSHAQALRQREDISFHTVVGRRPEPTKDFAAEFGFAHCTLEFDEALADDGIDAVIITSPSDLHARQTELALRAGKHVLVEIPLATNYADAERVTRVAKEVGRTLMVAHTERFYPALVELRRRVKADEFHVHHVVCRWYFFRRENVNWRGRRRSWTDNLLWHHACHVVDAVQWILGEPAVNVQSQMSPPHAQLGIPLDLSLLFRTPKHQLVNIAMSYNSPIQLHDYAFIGEEDTLTFASGQLTGKEGVVFAPEDPQPIYDQDCEFLAAVREGREPAVSGDAVLPAMRVLQCVQNSLATP